MMHDIIVALKKCKEIIAVHRSRTMQKMQYEIAAKYSKNEDMSEENGEHNINY